MAKRFPPDVIKCRACGARDVGVASGLQSDAAVSCCICGTVLWTWREFLQLIEAAVDDKPGSAEVEISRAPKEKRGHSE